MKRAYSILTAKAVGDSDERVIEGIASTPTTDRMGDVVDSLGAKFALPLPLLWQHEHDKPVGFVEFAEPTEKGIPFRARLATVTEAGPLRDRIEEAWQSLKAGLVRGVSIGFRSLEHSYIKETGGSRFNSWEWLELSLVTVPANAEATISTIKSIDKSIRAASGKSVARVTLPTAASGVKPTSKGNIKMSRKKTLAEQINEFKAARTEKSARMAEILDESEGSTLDADQQVEFDGLEAEIAEIDSHVKRLRAVQKATAESATAVEGINSPEAGTQARSGVVSARAKAAKPADGVRFARYARCLGLARKKGVDLMSVAETEYGTRDPELIGIIKAAVSAVNTTTDAALIGNEGGFADFVEFLRPQTIVGRLGAGGIPGLRRVPFRVPLITQTTGSTGYWVGEGAAKPLTKPSWGRTELAPLKAANIAVATMEALRDSSPSAELLLRDDLAAAIAAAVDVAFIDPTNSGSTGVKPASITDGLTPVASVGNDAASIREDARRAMGVFVSNHNPLSAGVWVMSSSTALALSLMRTALDQPEFSGVTINGGTFLGLPVVTSEHVDGYVVLMNASDIWFADDGEVAVDMSTEASLQMMDNPTVNSITPTATDLVSMFQTNSVAFRAERTLNWARRRTSGVALISGVAWGEPDSAS